MALGAKRKGDSMSALPSPRPQRKRQKSSRDEALTTIARLLEEQMDEMGLSETQKNTKTDELVDHVKKLKASRAATPSRRR
jgi:hypothetical protein